MQSFLFRQTKILSLAPSGSMLTIWLLIGRSSPTGREVNGMATKKKEIYIMPRKIYWHLYSLQNLNSEKFIKVVNKVLRKEYMLIK